MSAAKLPLAAKNSNKFTQSFPETLFLQGGGAQGCCGEEQSYGCFNPSRKPQGVHGPQGTHHPGLPTRPAQPSRHFH